MSRPNIASTLDRDALIGRALRSPAEVRAECSRTRQQSPAPSVADQITIGLAEGWADYAEGLLDRAAVAVAQTLALLSGHQGTAGGLVDVVRLEVAVMSAEGRLDEAEARLLAVIAGGPSLNRSRLFSTLGQIRASRRDFEAARVAVDDGLTDARRHADRRSEAALLVNRATALLESGDYGEAITDLELALSISDQLGDDAVRSVATHNLGVIFARRGEIQRALRHFEEARAFVARSSGTVAVAYSLRDQADVLLDVGLLEEAESATVTALAMFERLGSSPASASTSMHLARVQAAAGRWSDAVSSSSRAVDFAEDAAANAGDAVVRAAHELHDTLRLVRSVEHGEPGVDLLDEIEVSDLGHADLGMLLDGAVLLRRGGRVSEARTLIERCLELPQRSMPERLDHLVASAALADLAGDHASVSEAVQSGLDLASDYAPSLGVSELRTMLHRRIDQLAKLAIRSDLTTGRIDEVLATLEHVRSITLLPEPELSESDIATIASLRSVLRAIAEQDGPATDLLRERDELEARLRRTRRSAAHAAGPDDGPQGDSSLPTNAVYLFVVDEDLWLIRHDGPSGLVATTVAPIADLRRTLRAVHLTLGRWSMNSSNLTIEGLVGTLRSLLQPVLDVMVSPEAVIVPEPSLDAIPWALLTPVAISQIPSLALVTGAQISEPQGVEMAFFAGPDLELAEKEASTLGDRFPGSRRYVGDEATADNAIREFALAGLVHFAAHGEFRNDHPLNSSLRLAGGGLTFFDLLTSTAPKRVVFSACELGQGATSSPIGLAALLLARGSESVIASTGPARDTSASRLMIALYEQLADGVTFARALGAAQQRLIGTDPAVALFAAFGHG